MANNFTLARKQTEGKELTFKVVPIKGAKEPTFSVVDSEGYTCGIFSSEASANKAIKGIFNNVKHAKVLLNKSWYRGPFKHKYNGRSNFKKRS